MIEVAPGWHALGFSTSSVERSSGQHAKHLLTVVEEASGVEDFVFDAIDSLGYERLVCIGNPIRAESKFVDLIHQAARDRADNVSPRLAVHAIQIPSTESPHAHQEKSEFANSLDGHMKAKGISQVELAAAIGVGQPAISMMLSRDCRPQRRTVEKLARALGVPPNDLWPGFGSPDNALAGGPGG